jgi:23S rRNA pseudouridine2605 synthase
MQERLQKILASVGLASRRTAEIWIREGRVAVDGQVVVELGTKADPDLQRITVDGKPIKKQTTRHSYIAINKPKGVTCTLADRHAEKLITELVDLPGDPVLKPVGRLDANSEGLLFLSDDGDFIYRLTHPRYHVVKTYIATVRGVPQKDHLDRLFAGIRLEDGVTAPADRVRLVKTFTDNDTTDIEIGIHEGRKRQIRRMFDAIGFPVLRLVRIKIGDVTLGGLPASAWRHLTKTEIAKLLEPSTAVGSQTAAPTGRPKTPQRGSKSDG